MHFIGEVQGVCENCGMFKPLCIVEEGYIKTVCCKDHKINDYDKKTNHKIIRQASA